MSSQYDISPADVVITSFNPTYGIEEKITKDGNNYYRLSFKFYTKEDFGDPDLKNGRFNLYHLGANSNNPAVIRKNIKAILDVMLNDTGLTIERHAGLYKNKPFEYYEFSIQIEPIQLHITRKENPPHDDTSNS